MKKNNPPILPEDSQPANPPVMLDEVPVGGGGGMGGMGGMGQNGEFDELPIGKKAAFDISEFPEGGEEAPVETNYTM